VGNAEDTWLTEASWGCAGQRPAGGGRKGKWSKGKYEWSARGINSMRFGIPWPMTDNFAGVVQRDKLKEGPTMTERCLKVETIDGWIQAKWKKRA